MTADLPYGAAEIVATRKAGKKPADMILISLVGPLREMNPVVVARAEKSYDWRFLTRLEVLIVATTATSKESLARIVESILPHRPEYVGVWFADRQAGMNVAFGCWRLSSGRGMGAQEREALAGIGASV